jgi:hypothetical protein
MKRQGDAFLLFVVNNKDQYKVNLEIPSINTRQNSNKLYHVLPNLTTHQNGTYYSSIQIFNKLSSQIKILSHNVKDFKSALKNWLCFNSFSTLDEYFKSSKV